jgi:1,2-diacylglycerol 3-alpha-glucosyltransferase
MRIGLLVLSIGDFGNLNYYNNQEIGLAKALDGICDEVLVYRLILSKKQKTVESINNTKHSTAIMLPSKRIGTNGFVDYKELDDTLDALVCFSDTQIGFPGVYRWALKNKIKLIPYIGVCESHSNNRLKQCIIDKVFVRNISAYRKCTCLAKTPAVKDALLRQNINMVSVAPVGIDMTRLRTDYEQYDGQAIKEKYGFKKNDRIILFIGRLTKEKQPKKMIEIFRELHKLDDRYRLCIVGRGELRNDVAGLIEQSNLAPFQMTLYGSCIIWLKLS